MTVKKEKITHVWGSGSWNTLWLPNNTNVVYHDSSENLSAGGDKYLIHANVAIDIGSSDIGFSSNLIKVEVGFLNSSGTLVYHDLGNSSTSPEYAVLQGDPPNVSILTVSGSIVLPSYQAGGQLAIRITYVHGTDRNLFFLGGYSNITCKRIGATIRC